MIKAIIIDDEKSGRETLAFILEKHFTGLIQLQACGNSVTEGIALIEKHDPQLIFLDVEMPHEQGLALVGRLPEIRFEIIITTAHKQYGIDAIKAGVADYLLKPVDIEELERSLKKITEKIEAKAEMLQLKQMAASTSSKKIPLLVGNNKTIFVESSEIVRCQADGNYTRIWLSNGRSELITRLIKEVEALLPEPDFFRVHKSHLINVKHIKAFLKADDNISMTNDAIVPLSRNIKAEFIKKMDL